jgi:hypothetical protein
MTSRASSLCIHAEGDAQRRAETCTLVLLDSGSYVLAFNPSDSIDPNALAAAHEVQGGV